MKRLSALAVLIVAANSASAAGFQPWSERSVETSPDHVQSQIQPRSFYRSDVPQLNVNDAVDAEQADVVIKPWYTGGRV
tara:strand:- start:5784 stop:6020 length:237 start_codon:yes stop_codon:yes gene_type:complete